MKPEFKIFKEGTTTDGQVTISSIDGNDATGKPFDRKAKIQKYLALGYSVYELDGTEIKEA